MTPTLTVGPVAILQSPLQSVCCLSRILTEVGDEGQHFEAAAQGNAFMRKSAFLNHNLLSEANVVH